jgi:hypothetical protein
MTLKETLSECCKNRLKITVAKGSPDNLLALFDKINSVNIPTLNIGKLLAVEFEKKIDGKHLNLEAQEYLNKLVERMAVSIEGLNYKTICLHNLGFLFEPHLGIDEGQFIKEISKTYCVILLWDNELEPNGNLSWRNSPNKFQLKLTDTDYKLIELNNEI